MAYGDKSFYYLTSGSTTTSAATAHNLFGNYGGMSVLNSQEVVFISLAASGGDMRLSADPATPATNGIGLRLTVAASYYDLPPMFAGDASQITFAREGANNSHPNWTIWVRRP